MGSSSPNRVENKKYLSCHHPEKVRKALGFLGSQINSRTTVNLPKDPPANGRLFPSDEILPQVLDEVYEGVAHPKQTTNFRLKTRVIVLGTNPNNWVALSRE